MKMSGGVLCGGSSRSNAVPLFLNHHAASLRISSSSSIPGNTIISSHLILILWFFPFFTFSVIAEHVSFVKDVAVTQPPQHLSQLLTILKTRGTIFPLHLFFLYSTLE